MSDSGDGTFADAADERWPLLALLDERGRGNRRWLALGALGSTGAQLLSNVDMLIIGLAFDAMFNERAFTLWLVPDGWIPQDPIGVLGFTVALLAVLKVIDMCLGIFAQWAMYLFSQRTLHRVRVDAFDAVGRLDASFFDEQRTGEVMSVLNNDVNSLEDFLSFAPNLAVVAATLFGSSLLYMAILNPRLALISLLIAPVLLAVNHWFGGRHEVRTDAVLEEVGDLNAVLETTVGGVTTVKAYGGEARERSRVERASDAQRLAAWRSHLVGVVHRPTMRLLVGVGFLLTLLVGTAWELDGRFLFLTGTITAGELIPFLYYTQQLAQPVRFAAWITGLYKAGNSAAKRIVGITRLERPREDGSVELDRPRGRISLENVTYGYDDEPVLRDVTVEIEPGETVGLVGPTGAGKSTLLSLLLAYYDPDGGRIAIDGTDVGDCSRSSVREAIGCVQQDPYLFSGTVRENVAYGVDDATDEAVEAAARAAGAHEFVAALEDGYETEVGQRGVRLSGGQRQRIAIARVLLSDPSIFVFDEATSHVDNRTEVLIQRSLERLTADRTTIVVAHRLSTVRNADRILVLEDGEITERGTHDDLLERDGIYADLWRVQTGDLAAAER